MKKIFVLIASACALAACEPAQENFKNDGHITLDELRAKTTVTVDQAENGLNGNVVTCETLAPVVAKWTVGGKSYNSNSAWKKMKKGAHDIYLEALCPDGTMLMDTFHVTCDTITNALERFYIYGEPGSGQEPFTPGAWDAAQMRFSDNEGKHFPFLSDDVYWGLKTLIMDASDPVPGNQMSIMNGWWSAFYAEGIEIVAGPNEIQLTKEMATDCARGNGGAGKDLQFMFKNGTATINSVYYEE